MSTTSMQCDPESLQELVAAVASADNDAAIIRLTRALDRWPDDARIHFLRASCLAEGRRYDEAAREFEAAVELQPDLSIARFQLGLLHLTSGQSEQALAVWAPLRSLHDADALVSFVGGLTALVQDRFDDCVDLLRAGIESNTAYPPLNRDMLLVIDRVNDLRAGAAAQPAAGANPEEGRHLLLAEYLSSKTRH